MKYKMWPVLVLVLSVAACDTTEQKIHPTERPNAFAGLSEPLQPVVCTPTETTSQSNDAPFMEDNMTRTVTFRSTGPKILEVRTSAPGKPDKIELRRINDEADGVITSMNGERNGSRLTVHDIVIERPGTNGEGRAVEQIIRWSNDDSRENTWKFACRAAS